MITNEKRLKSVCTNGISIPSVRNILMQTWYPLGTDGSHIKSVTGQSMNLGTRTHASASSARNQFNDITQSTPAAMVTHRLSTRDLYRTEHYPGPAVVNRWVAPIHTVSTPAGWLTDYGCKHLSSELIWRLEERRPINGQPPLTGGLWRLVYPPAQPHTKSLTTACVNATNTRVIIGSWKLLSVFHIVDGSWCSVDYVQFNYGYVPVKSEQSFIAVYTGKIKIIRTPCIKGASFC